MHTNHCGTAVSRDVVTGNKALFLNSFDLFLVHIFCPLHTQVNVYGLKQGSLQLIEGL